MTLVHLPQLPSRHTTLQKGENPSLDTGRHTLRHSKTPDCLKPSLYSSRSRALTTALPSISFALQLCNC